MSSECESVFAQLPIVENLAFCLDSRSFFGLLRSCRRLYAFKVQPFAKAHRYKLSWDVAAALGDLNTIRWLHE